MNEMEQQEVISAYKPFPIAVKTPKRKQLLYPWEPPKLKKIKLSDQFKELITKEAVSSTSAGICPSWPNVWNRKMYMKYKSMYRWLVCNDGNMGCKICQHFKGFRSGKTQELWANCSVVYTGSGQKKQQVKSLGKKIITHSNSKPHRKCIKRLRRTKKTDQHSKQSRRGSSGTEQKLAAGFLKLVQEKFGLSKPESNVSSRQATVDGSKQENVDYRTHQIVPLKKIDNVNLPGNVKSQQVRMRQPDGIGYLRAYYSTPEKVDFSQKQNNFGYNGRNQDIDSNQKNAKDNSHQSRRTRRCQIFLWCLNLLIGLLLVVTFTWYLWSDELDHMSGLRIE